MPIVMLKWLVKFLGLRGSWSWACKEMDRGRIVCRTTDTGAARYRLDGEGQRRIEWSFGGGWESAYIFLDDFECTDWVSKNGYLEGK